MNSVFWGLKFVFELLLFFVICATLILAFNSSSKYDRLASSCRNNRGGMSEVVSACTDIGWGRRPDARTTKPTVECAWLGQLLQRTLQEAIGDYNVAADLQPDDETPFLRRALAQEALGAVSATEAAYENALAIDPEKVFARFDPLKDRR